MDTAGPQLLLIARQVVAVATRAHQAMQQAQNDLQLELVLTPQRLGSAAGTAASIQTLDRFSELNAAHKAAFTRFSTAATEQLLAAVAELPADQAQQARDGMVASINWQMAAQGRFHGQRDTWIGIARSICQLVDDNRDQIQFGEDSTFLFSDDNLMAEFEDLVDRADQIHREEVAQTTERLARLSNVLSSLGPERR